MNEPHFGYIGHPSLHEFDYNTHLHLGDIRGFIYADCKLQTFTLSTYSVGTSIIRVGCGASDSYPALDSYIPLAI